MHPAAASDPHRVQRLVRQRQPHQPPQPEPAQPTPTAAPTAICRANSADALGDRGRPGAGARRQQADHQGDADRVVRSRLTLQDGPGPARRSPGGPARRTPPPGRSGTTRCRSTTPAGQSNPNSTCAATANAAAVTTVPATPSHTTAPAAARNRRHPMCMPPSNRMNTNATVTICSSTWTGTDRNPGNTVGAHRGGDQEQRRRRNAQPLADPIENTASSTAADTPPPRRRTRSARPQRHPHRKGSNLLNERRPGADAGHVAARVPGRTCDRSEVRHILCDRFAGCEHRAAVRVCQAMLVVRR